MAYRLTGRLPGSAEIVGRWADAEHYRLRDFLTRIAQPYGWLEAGSAGADRFLQERGTGLNPIPEGTRGPPTSREGGETMPMSQDRTKEQLYRQAKRLDIKGRSKMNKGQLKAAIARRGH